GSHVENKNTPSTQQNAFSFMPADINSAHRSQQLPCSRDGARFLTSPAPAHPPLCLFPFAFIKNYLDLVGFTWIRPDSLGFFGAFGKSPQSVFHLSRHCGI